MKTGLFCWALSKGHSGLTRFLQTIRLGSLRMSQRVEHALMTQVPKNMNQQLQKLGLAPLFATPPKS
jgi:hypothetical protein